MLATVLQLFTCAYPMVVVSSFDSLSNAATPLQASGPSFSIFCSCQTEHACEYSDLEAWRSCLENFHHLKFSQKYETCLHTDAEGLDDFCCQFLKPTSKTEF